MGNEYRAKVFKSGNSVALRLPKALGIAEGTEMCVREEAGKFSFEPVDRPKRKFDVDAIWGIGVGSGMQLIKSEDRIFEHRPLLWEDPEWMARLEKNE